MKTTWLSLVLLCTQVLAITKRGKRVFQEAGPLLEHVRLGHFDKVEKALNYTESKGFGSGVPMRVYNNPPNLEVINEKPQFFQMMASRRAKVRYGPFTVDPMSQHDGMIDELLLNPPMPCKNCTITNMQAWMEYPNGTIANANTSLWLHHMVMINMNRVDTVCGKGYYAQGQRWWATGNERTQTGFSLNGQVPVGYYVGAGDVMVIEIELMNQGMYPQEAVPVIDYEWIDGFPDGFFQAKPIWMDIAGCHIASDMPTKGDVFSYTSPSYVSNFNGQIIGMGGHLHDGGLNLEIWQDVKYQLCNSVAHYGLTPGYIDAPGTSMTMPMAPMFNPMTHISNMSFCYAPIKDNFDHGGVTNGTLLQITANYNFTERMPMLTTDGDYDDIMGIAIIYVAENMTKADLVKALPNAKPAPLDVTPPLTGMYGLGMMPTGGDDDDGGDEKATTTTNSTSDSMAGMGMGGMGGMGMGGETLPECNPMRDSPGTITLQNLNMSDPSTMQTLLTAILCDTCLQAWSAPFARYFWYGIVVIIGLFSVTRMMTWNSHILRKHKASRVRPDVYEIPSGLSRTSAAVSRLVRRISYRQYTPTSLPGLVKLPPVGVVLMIVGYFAFLCALQFTNAKTGDLQTWQFLGVRAAWLSVAQLPLIVLLSAKRNFITMVTAVTYERLNVLHRWTARGLLMTTLMHFGFQWYGWAQAGVVQYELSDECIPTGAAALALVLWMNLSTLTPFRSVCYELFVLQHIVTFFGLIIAVAYHAPSTAPFTRTYVYVSVALYLVSKLYQLTLYVYHNIQPAKAVLYPVSDRITKVTLKAPPMVKSWAPGSFVLLRIPRFGLLQSHPASIATTPRSHGGDMTFFLLKRRGFTRSLANADMSPTRSYTAFIDGPYGASQHDFAAFHTSILFAGSTGITFILPILMDIAQRAQCVNIPLKRIYLVWSIKEISLVSALREEIAKAVRDLHAVGITAEVSIHITGSSFTPLNPFLSGPVKESRGSESPKLQLAHLSSDSNSESDDHATRIGSQDDTIEKAPVRVVRALSHDGDSDSQDSDSPATRFSRSVQVLDGRPNLDGALEASQNGCDGEMAVAVCGPLSMSKQIRNKVAAMQGADGGVYLHVEGFAW